MLKNPPSYPHPRFGPSKSTQISRKKMRTAKKCCVASYKVKQNDSHTINQGSNQSMLRNQDLIKGVLKPNRINYLNKISEIYDLVLANAKLPESLQYFLGQALYTLHSSNHIHQFMTKTHNFEHSSQSKYSIVNSTMKWKFNQFKQICIQIYDDSDIQDLKNFMNVPLPPLNRWKPQLSRKIVNTTDTLMSQNSLNISSKFPNTNAKYCRSKYFGSLIKKQGGNGAGFRWEEQQALDRLTDKVNAYLANYASKMENTAILD